MEAVHVEIIVGGRFAEAALLHVDGTKGRSVEYIDFVWLKAYYAPVFVM